MSLENLSNKQENSTPESSVDMGTFIKQRVQEEFKFDKENQAKLSNEYYTQEFNDLIENGLIEDLGYFSKDDEKSDDVVLENMEQGYKVSHFNVYGDNGEIIGEQIYRMKKDLSENDSSMKNALEEKYKNLNADKSYQVEQMREQKLNDAVTAGTMEYLGEMSIPEYGKLRTEKDLKYENIEKLFVFDENHEPIIDRIKVYVKI